MGPLAGKTALVTGAAAPRGIGRAIALRLVQDGAAVALGDMAGEIATDVGAIPRFDLLDATAEEMRSAGGRAMAVELDVTDPDGIASALGAVRDSFGPLDILVNNAGSLAGACDFLEATPEQWRASFEVNLLGPVRLCRAAIPDMRARGGGRIINIGSTGSLGAEPGFGAYTAMKHGLIGLTKTLAAEFGLDGILCNAVCPGFIDTDMHAAANARLAQEQGRPEAEVKADRYAAVALRRAGAPQDVAEAVAYLAGPQGAYVTGVALPVAGGVPPGL